jgi:hypothetical protein
MKKIVILFTNIIAKTWQTTYVCACVCVCVCVRNRR